MSETFIHPSAEIEDGADIGPGTSVWNHAKVRTGARIGPDSRIGQGCFIDHDVPIGAGAKIQNGVNVYHGVEIGDRVFVGPNATFTNDRWPRAASEDWEVVPTYVHDDVSIGAGAVIVCGVTIGRGAMVGAGAVVTRDVAAHTLVAGNPARLVRALDGPDAGPSAGRSDGGPVR